MALPLEKLTHALAKLPSVGHKTALRLALHILKQEPQYGHTLAEAISETITTLRFCEDCFNISYEPLCNLCVAQNRNPEVLCVVEEVSDLMALESTRSYKGLYHVLQGVLSPMDGVGPDDLKIFALMERLKKNPHIKEIILATNPNVNGDATALYLSKLFKNYSQVKITKLASGIPMGASIEYIDHHTLSRALEQRGLFL